MSIDLNDEIVQDFLVEAGELLEQLGEQLVEMEIRPDDENLLNSVFRSFHTVKGGAGFLALTSLVEVCHKAEDIFNLLRNQELQVNSTIMDVILRTLDVVNDMFDEIREGNDPSPAPADVMDALSAILSGEAPQVANEPEKTVKNEEIKPVAPAEGNSDEITDDEFEALLDALQEGGAASVAENKPVAAESNNSDTITDDEFEALLDELQGSKPADKKLSSDTGDTGKPQPQPDAVVEIKQEVKKDPTVTTQKPKAVKAPPGETTVRVDTNVLDHIMNMVGELVLVRNRLNALDTVNTDEELAKAVNNLDVVTTDIQNGVMRTRMQPIKKVFGRFPRVVRDLARTLNKDIVLEMQGEETDLDKNLVEALADPLIHLVRNSVDHGIESPEEREAASKPRKGTITLAAQQEGDHILLTIEDDGAGMDADVLRQIAVEKGVMDQDAVSRLSDKEAFSLIFAPGFSTKKEISDVSGRGVGMDVVKTKITSLNGSIDIDSTIGKGTIIIIKVPLTLAIVPTLMVMLADQIFALPLVNVNEIFDLNHDMTNIVDGQLVARVRDKPMPLFFLGKWLIRNTNDETSSGKHVVVVHIGNRQLGFVVDKLLGQEEVVIKPLGAMLQGTKGLAGATITGDGRIALILDVPALVTRYAGNY